MKIIESIRNLILLILAIALAVTYVGFKDAPQGAFKEATHSACSDEDAFLSGVVTIPVSTVESENRFHKLSGEVGRISTKIRSFSKALSYIFVMTYVSALMYVLAYVVWYILQRREIIFASRRIVIYIHLKDGPHRFSPLY